MTPPQGRTIERAPRGDLVAAVKSLVVPGWGQWGQGRRRTAMLYFRGLIVVGTAVIALVALGPSRLAELAVTPSALLAFIAGYVVVAAVWLAGVWDAFTGGGGRRSPASRGGLVMVAVLAVPLVWFGWSYLVRPYQTLNRVFGGNEVSATESTTTTAPSVAPPDEGSGDTTTTTVVETTTTTSPDPFAGKDHVNLLLLGGDAGPGRRGVRTDTMILASIDTRDGDVALFGYPRGLSGLSFPDGTPFTAYQGILNEVYIYGTDNPELFPAENPGAEAITQMIEGLSGVEIDYYVLVNLEAFVDVVDALGGVTLYVPDTIIDDEYPKEDGTTISIRIEEGVQELNGTEALAYVRSRRQGSDYSRMGRQRCFLAAVAAQVDVPSLITGLPRLLDTIEENVITDIPLETLPDFLELAGRARPTEAITLTFGPDAPWISRYTEARFPVPDPVAITRAIALAQDDPDAARAAYDLAPVADACEYGDDPTAAPTTRMAI